MNQTKRVGSETSLSLIYLLLNYVNVLYFLKNKTNRENKVNPKIENRLKLITLTRYQIGYIITQWKEHRKELLQVTLEYVVLVYILGGIYSKEKKIAIISDFAQ